MNLKGDEGSQAPVTVLQISQNAEEGRIQERCHEQLWWRAEQEEAPNEFLLLVPKPIEIKRKRKKKRPTKKGRRAGQGPPLLLDSCNTENGLRGPPLQSHSPRTRAICITSQSANEWADHPYLSRQGLWQSGDKISYHLEFQTTAVTFWISISAGPQPLDVTFSIWRYTLKMAPMVVIFRDIRRHQLHFWKWDDFLVSS